MKTKGKPQVGWSRDDYIIAQLQSLRDDFKDLRDELKETRRELNARMDKLEGRMDRIESEMRSGVRHSHIMTASVVGIALAVIYFVFKH